MKSSGGNVNRGFETSRENMDIEEIESPSSKKTVEKRPVWGNRIEFLLSCVSMSVGLGNIWRFPFTAYENGGGAFLIPYVIVLLLVGKPIYYMEMTIGQFTSRGSVKCWESVPALKGIGIGQSYATFLVNSYYCSLIALTLFYMIKSFAVQLPWATCWSTWTELCVDSASNLNEGSNGTTTATTSSELFFIKEVIKEKPNIDDGIGLPDLTLSLWLLFAWICIFLVIMKGVKSSGKLSYFLAIFPYVIMFILLVRACTLEGAINGIKYFFQPNFKRLLEPVVWYKAMTQMFFSLSAGMGPVISYASYNEFDHNIYRDAMIVTTLDTLTSILGGTVIFGILGNLARNSGEKDISKVIKSGGSSLAFISYPDAISKFNFAPQVFSVLFFFMLYVLGVGCAVGYHSSIITNITDHLSAKFKHWQVAGVGCVIAFFIGLIYVTPGGQWMLTLIDFGSLFLIFPLTTLQLIGFFWIYGVDNFCLDLEFMIGKRVSKFWRVAWGIVTPTLMIVIFIYAMFNMQQPTYGSSEFPSVYLILIWVLIVLGFVPLMFFMIFPIIRNILKSDEGRWTSRLIKSIHKEFSPTTNWGPANLTLHQKWMNYKQEFNQKRDDYSQKLNHSWIKRKIGIFLGKYRDSSNN